MGACKDCAPNHHEMVANYPPHHPPNKTPPEIPQKTQMSTGSNHGKPPPPANQRITATDGCWGLLVIKSLPDFNALNSDLVVRLIYIQSFLTDSIVLNYLSHGLTPKFSVNHY